MVAFVVKDFGGMVPRQDPRLLPDQMAEIAINCDLAAGPLDGLPQPEFIIDLAAAASWPVRKAYRLPGPTISDPDVWMPLPSEFSSVVRSPLANDTLHAVYWTNPQGQPDAGAWWNTYARIAAGGSGANVKYNMGFLAPDPTIMLTVEAAGGTHPQAIPVSASVVDTGAGYIPGTYLFLAPDPTTDPDVELAPGQTSFSAQIQYTEAVGATMSIVSGGSGGIDSTGLFEGSTGDGGTPAHPFMFNGTISGGALVSIDGFVSFGAYTQNPIDLANEPIIGGGLVGASVRLEMGASVLHNFSSTAYLKAPTNPVATFSPIVGSVIPATVNVLYTDNGAPPLIERVYVFTYIDQYGFESSPSTPSAVVAGASDDIWKISGFPAFPPTDPPGKNYPDVVKMRLYRTITSNAGQADFYFVSDVVFSGDPAMAFFIDAEPDTRIVNNNTLLSASWIVPPDNLDGLTAMPGGMLVGFTANTIHFCEPNRPHAWPAGYDQSLLYQIVGLAVWQQSLVVLTHGYPSTGAGTSPVSFVFAQVQAPEPCIARGSIVTDLAGVYYASQNGLIMLNYFGMQNQTLSNLTRQIWLTDYRAASIIACRHRAQYMALNAPGAGFIIDYTEQRMGITQIASALGGMTFISVWNDVYVDDTYMCDTSGKVWRWDAVTTPSLNYQWRSKQFYLPAPTSLGACQISLDSSISDPGPTPALPESPMSTGLPVLPGGVRALFRLFAGPGGNTMTLEKTLTQPREIFRLPSGRKAFCWQFEIVANVPVHSVELASTMRELKKV
jgi:hypothetical protein